MLVAAQTSARSFGTWAALGEHIGLERRFVDSYLSFGNQAVVIEEGRTYIPCLSFEDTCMEHFALASGHRKKVDRSMNLEACIQDVVGIRHTDFASAWLDSHLGCLALLERAQDFVRAVANWGTAAWAEIDLEMVEPSHFRDLGSAV
jgi:hypothetical protein